MSGDDSRPAPVVEVTQPLCCSRGAEAGNYGKEDQPMTHRRTPRGVRFTLKTPFGDVSLTLEVL